VTVGSANEFRRREGNKARVRELLRSSGARGAYNHELVAVGGMRAVGARLTELRAEGLDIETINEGGGLFRFVLHEPARHQKCAHCQVHFIERDGLCLFCINAGIKPQLMPGQPGYLASLPILSSIDDNRHETHTTDDEPAEGRLFR
jgi:hypothetical protein